LAFKRAELTRFVSRPMHGIPSKTWRKTAASVALMDGRTLTSWVWNNIWFDN